MKKNIIVLLLSSAPGGVHNRSQLLVSELSKTHQVDIIYVYDDKPLSKLSILALIHTYQTKLRLLRKADLVISFSLLPNLLATFFAKTSLICPTGSSWHDKDARLISRIYWTYILQPITYILANAIVPASPTIIPSYAQKLWMLSRKIHHIYGFIDYAKLRSVRQVISANTTKDPTEEYLLFLGSLTTHKGATECLHIYQRARSIRPDLPPLLYCGSGPLTSLLRSECSRLFPTSKHINCSASRPPVIFVDHVEDPYRIIYGSKIMLAPSYYEGLSNAILEGLYLAPAVIATKHSSNLFIESKLRDLELRNNCYSDKFVLLPFPDCDGLLDRWAKVLINKYDDTCNRSFSKPYPEIGYFSTKQNVGKWIMLIKSLTES